MLEIAKRNFNAQSPVIAFFDVFYSKAVRQIGDAIFICIFVSFYFDDTKLHEIKMPFSSVKKFIKMRSVYKFIHCLIWGLSRNSCEGKLCVWNGKLVNILYFF